MRSSHLVTGSPCHLVIRCALNCSTNSFVESFGMIFMTCSSCTIASSMRPSRMQCAGIAAARRRIVRLDGDGVAVERQPVPPDQRLKRREHAERDDDDRRDRHAWRDSTAAT